MRFRHYFLCLAFLMLCVFSAPAAEWDTTITVSNIDDPLVPPQLLTFGVSFGASDGYSAMDVPIPPPAPSAISLDAAFIIPSPFFPRLSKDIRLEAVRNQWQLDVRSDTGGINLTWDISAIPWDRCVFISSGEIIDMRMQNSLDLSQGQHSLLLEVYIDPDLAVTKIVNDSAPGEGDTIAYTVRVTNNGPNNATGIEVTDILPPGLTYLSDTPGQGSYDSITGIWSIGDLADGSVATLSITVIVDPYTAGDTITNIASVTALDQIDQNSGNDSASINITVQGEDTTPPAKVTLSIDSTTTNTITLTWIAPGDDGIEGTASQYDIRYSESQIKKQRQWKTATWCDNEPLPLSGGERQSFTVIGLSPNTSYHFALKTADEALNWSAISNSVGGTTMSDGAGNSDQEMRVPGILMSLGSTGSNVNAIANIVVLSSSDGPVSNVEVSGSWSGKTCDRDSGLTNELGEVVFRSDRVKKPQNGDTFTFVVERVEKAGWVYDSSASVTSNSIVYTEAAPANTMEFSEGLGDAYPNPGNPDIWIPFTLSEANLVSIRIHDMAGRLVRTMELGRKAPGAYINKSKAAHWDGKNEAGEQVSSGTYFYTMQTGEFTATRKLLIIR